MRNKYSKGLVIAMEDEMPVEEVSGDEVEEALDDVDQLVEETSDVADDVTDLADATDATETDMSTLEEIKEVMEESVEKGEGLDETAAKIAEVAIESIYDRIGIKLTTSVVPAMESFGSKNTRLAATNIAIEGITDSLKTAWAAVISAIKRAKDYIVEWFKKFFTSNGKLKEVTKKMETSIKESDFDKKVKVTMKDVAETFNIEGKASADTVKVVLQASNALMRSCAKQKEILTEASSLIEAAVKDGKLPDEGKVKAFVSAVESAFKSSAEVKESDSPEGKEYKITFDKTGGKVISFDIVHLKAGFVTISKNITDEPEIKDFEVETCDFSTAKNIIANVTTANAMADEVKKATESASEYSAKVVKVAEDLLKKVDSDKGPALSKSDVSDLRKFILGVQAMMNFMTVEAANINMRVSKVALGYVQKSASAKKEKAE
jgi:hypothetical protein